MLVAVVLVAGAVLLASAILLAACRQADQADKLMAEAIERRIREQLGG